MRSFEAQLTVRIKRIGRETESMIRCMTTAKTSEGNLSVSVKQMSMAVMKFR